MQTAQPYKFSIFIFNFKNTHLMTKFMFSMFVVLVFFGKLIIIVDSVIA